MDTGLTHDWASGDFLPSQIVEAVGLAIGITSLVTFAVSNITPPQAAAIAATIQIARLFGIELGTAFIQTFVRIREQVYSNWIGQHLSSGSDVVERIVTAALEYLQSARQQYGPRDQPGDSPRPAGSSSERPTCSPISTASGSSPGCWRWRPCWSCSCVARRQTT